MPGWLEDAERDVREEWGNLPDWLQQSMEEEQDHEDQERLRALNRDQDEEA